MQWRVGMEGLSPSTINVRLSAMRKMVGEARRAGMIGSEEAASLTDIPNINQKGTRVGNWLTREQAKELLAVPDRSILKGKRDYVILALLVGCALRRNELAELDVETIQQREGRWVLADLEGKGRRIRTVAIPMWVKQGINAWMTAAGVEDGRLLRSVSKSGKVNRDTLSDWAVWSVVVHAVPWPLPATAMKPSTACRRSDPMLPKEQSVLPSPLPGKCGAQPAPSAGRPIPWSRSESRVCDDNPSP
jgi:site-specific recombinase XerD